MNKIKLSEFWNSKEKLAIHCKTEEQAIKLLKEFDKIDKKWASGNSYLEVNCWNEYEEDTCYSNSNGYTFINWYKKNNYKIYDFEDVDFEEEKKMKRKIKLRDMTKEQWDKFLYNCYTISDTCSDTCPFGNVRCLKSECKSSWFNNKDLFSDKFLNQEIEIEESSILDEEEKEYLSNVIKPFRDRVIIIEKSRFDDSCFISITVKSKRESSGTKTECINLPFFKEDTMYKGMENNKEYTLKELGL